jgi:hypothetical protein
MSSSTAADCKAYRRWSEHAEANGWKTAHARPFERRALSALFVENLMGFQDEWTVSERSATPSSPRKVPTPSVCAGRS